MRVGLVLDDTLDTSDGVQQYVLSVGAWLTGQGHEVHYLVGHTVRTDITHLHSLSKNVSVRFNGNRMSMPLPASKRELRQLLHEQKFDILHVQVPYSPFLAGRILKLVPKETAVVGTFHILPYSGLVRLANSWLAMLNSRSARRFDRLMAVSEPARVFAQATYAYQNMQIVPNPVRLEQFRGAVAASPQLTIVFLGRLVERKGAQHLLAALVELRRLGLHPDDYRVVVGGTGELEQSLRQYVTANDLDETVEFAGFITEADKAAFLAQADIAVFPSTSGESFGIVLLEAMAAARGVVLAGNNPGYVAVMDHMAEHIIEPLETGRFAESLAAWLNDAEARSIAAANQKEYVKRFDVSVVGQQLEAVYEQALQSRRPT
jgi:phosphatidylinositol alpha-mannosyltransferase